MPSIHNKILTILPVLAYIFVIVLPMPWYLSYLPPYILLALIFIIPPILVLALAKMYKKTLRLSMFEVILLMAGWFIVVILSYARALGEMKDSKAGIWWTVGGALALLWLVLPLLVLYTFRRRINNRDG
jgi:hypothetical protein